MAVNYPKDNRMYDDCLNSNQRFYRESEIHGRLFIADEHMRENFGYEKKIYEQLNDPNEQFQEI